jgi:hypothetical protein
MLRRREKASHVTKKIEWGKNELKSFKKEFTSLLSIEAYPP